MQFRPFVYDAMNQQVSVAIEPMTPQDAATTTREPRWQTDWTSEYISKGKFDIYGLKTQIGELVALGAYEISEDYSCFDALPVAFADIEMVVNEERRAVDWIFRYGNPALAKLEKIPLERLIGSSFSSLFSNMDAKWLRSYERAALYGETLEIIDYSPEIDTYLRVICFPTFKGHCGCILFDVSEIKFTQSSSDTSEALLRYFGKLLEQNC